MDGDFKFYGKSLISLMLLHSQEESTDESGKKGKKYTSIMLQPLLGDFHKDGMIKFVSQDHLEKLEESTLFSRVVQGTTTTLE